MFCFGLANGSVSSLIEPRRHLSCLSLQLRWNGRSVVTVTVFPFSSTYES